MWFSSKLQSTFINRLMRIMSMTTFVHMYIVNIDGINRMLRCERKVCELHPFVNVNIFIVTFCNFRRAENITLMWNINYLANFELESLIKSYYSSYLIDIVIIMKIDLICLLYNLVLCCFTMVEKLFSGEYIRHQSISLIQPWLFENYIRMTTFPLILLIFMTKQLKNCFELTWRQMRRPTKSPLEEMFELV